MKNWPLRSSGSLPVSLGLRVASAWGDAGASALVLLLGFGGSLLLLVASYGGV